MQESIAYEGCCFPFSPASHFFYALCCFYFALSLPLSALRLSHFHSVSYFVVVVFGVFLLHWNRFGFTARKSVSLVSGCGCAVRVYFTRCFTEMCAFAKHHAIERNVCIRLRTHSFVCECMRVTLIVHRVSDRDGTKAKIVVSMCCSVDFMRSYNAIHPQLSQSKW